MLSFVPPSSLAVLRHSRSRRNFETTEHFGNGHLVISNLLEPRQVSSSKRCDEQAGVPVPNAGFASAGRFLKSTAGFCGL